MADIAPALRRPGNSGKFWSVSWCLFTNIFKGSLNVSFNFAFIDAFLNRQCIFYWVFRTMIIKTANSSRFFVKSVNQSGIKENLFIKLTTAFLNRTCVYTQLLNTNPTNSHPNPSNQRPNKRNTQIRKKGGRSKPRQNGDLRAISGQEESRRRRVPQGHHHKRESDSSVWVV